MSTLRTALWPCGTRIFLPRIADKHRCHAGCFYQKTQIARVRTDGSFHGFFTLAPLPTAWFLMQRIDTDFFACGEWVIMLNVACEMLSGHAGCFVKKTPISPMRTDGSFHGFFTLAPLPTAWFLMRRRRNGSTRNFSQAESCVGECHTMGLLGMRKICGNARDLWATTKRAMC